MTHQEPSTQNTPQTEIAIDTGPDLSSAETARIVAAQNDAFRKAIGGETAGTSVPPGRVVMTRCVSERDPAFQSASIAAVVAYDDFDADCDPHGWHEMGVIEIEGETVWFKLDLYDENYEYGSSDPTDPRFTRRVLTLLFPFEY
ncbi:MAG: DUF3768 domain-containing protein [Rhizobiaceae bacterium]|nr:DUF3768 domain-containing protein [Rhizobiaceae bacterium]